MTQENSKQLLLKDLTARLPYGVKIELTWWVMGEGIGINTTLGPECIEELLNDEDGNTEIKPYLRPMSSMTEEEFTNLKEYSGLKYDQLDLASFQNGTYKCLDFYLSEVPSAVVIKVFDWLNRYHFDYRNLIPMDLAIAVTKENNPYKEENHV